MSESSIRKLRMVNPTLWEFHRGGWTYAINAIQENLCCQDGVRFISSVEDMVLEENVLKEAWVGFVHQIPKNNYEYFPDLERLVKDNFFIESLKYCQGLFTLSHVVKDYITQHVPNIPVVKVLYLSTPTDKCFDPRKLFETTERSLYFIGEYMRNFQYFFDLKVPSTIKKKLLLSPDVNLDKFGVKTNESVEIISYLEESAYDDILSSNVVFLNLIDAPANTTVIECITRNTPIVVNRLPGLEEYLGEKYPLFYDTTDEALELLTNDSKIIEGHEYLKTLPIKGELTKESFVSSIEKSAVYMSLPVPKSQQTKENTHFPTYDISVVICSYKRVYNMSRLLQCFVDQTTDKTFEVIVWNNNFEARDELQAICDGYMSKLNLKVIHSTENYYCIIRLAALSLIRSDIMMICDDDVVPTPLFLQGYMLKYEEYGRDAVLCCRGHRWWTHELDEENPDACWSDYESIKFFDESREDIRVHFLHADTCLFPKHLVMKAIQYPLPWYDMILVDDYWLSFVFSHHLRVPIWKIKGNHLFETTPCSEDASIALYLNKRVMKERIRMYIYHMRQGWPNDAIAIEELEEENKSDDNEKHSSED